MALPNPGMDAVPFTPLTAEFLDDMIENIESLSDGTGFQNGAITTNTLAESAVTASKLGIQSSYLGSVVSGSGDVTYNNTTFADIPGLTGLNITTTKPNQTILLILKAQSYGQAGYWKIQSGTTDITPVNQVGYGTMTTMTAVVVFIATIASSGSYTLKAVAKAASTNGHRIINSEGQAMLAAIALH